MHYAHVNVCISVALAQCLVLHWICKVNLVQHQENSSVAFPLSLQSSVGNWNWGVGSGWKWYGYIYSVGMHSYCIIRPPLYTGHIVLRVAAIHKFHCNKI